jgi:molybdopterin-synthase adenylyltransferase
MNQLDPLDPRFERQVRFGGLGAAGQARLGERRCLLVGCGALGSVLAQSLVRSGVGELVLVDRDVVELSNLPRQVLFEDRHAREGTLKVEASRETLERIGGPTRLYTHAEHLDAHNIERLAAGAQLVLDGTDNLATRYLINDYCVSRRVPWIYGGVVGAGGVALPVLPGIGPCLRCLFPEPPPAGALPTCDTVGVLQPAVGAIASLQAGLALRLLSAPDPLATDLDPAFLEVDVWRGEVRSLRAGRDPGCPCCGRGLYPFLESAPSERASALCGRDAVQVRGSEALDLAVLEARLEGLAREVLRRGPLLRFAVDGVRLTVFGDGRALVEGTGDVARALAIYDRYVGS